MEPTFTEACAFVMPIGKKYPGKTLARIGSSDEGLKYLDWMVGQNWIHHDLKQNLIVYLRHPAIAMQLDRAIESREDWERKQELDEGEE